jgi:glycosyltransferase involved in cell wall biosynthesis
MSSLAMPNPPPPAAAPVLVTVIVKALNEERGIGACLRSALAELEGMAGEVILADSVSRDKTVEIATGLDVNVVQFTSVADRNCGAALQLGYQYARGEFIYVLDGDMTLQPGFLRLALAYLRDHPEVAGVGGKLIDNQVLNVADRLRVAYYGTLATERRVASLGGGGLYRRSAIEQVGYLANRWLPAFEEVELGARLQAAGWQLVRLPAPAVSHCGHHETSFKMMLRLWRSGRIEASGIFLRGAVGRAWLRHAIRACWFVFAAPLLYLLVVLSAAAGALAGGPFWPLLAAAWLAWWGGALLLMVWRKKNLYEGLIALLAWHLYALGAGAGFLKPAGDPRAAIDAQVLHAAQVRD